MLQSDNRKYNLLLKMNSTVFQLTTADFILFNSRMNEKLDFI
jgi:hypothetical protein